MIDFRILNEFSRDVQFTAQIDARESSPESYKKGLSVLWALENNVDLRGANLRDADIRGADLRVADLRGADLRGANLTDAHLDQSDLSGADLTYANLTDACLFCADLTGANLTDANLTGANLIGVNLTDVNMVGVTLKSPGPKLNGEITINGEKKEPGHFFVNTDVECYEYEFYDLMQISEKEFEVTWYDGSTNIIPRSKILAITTENSFFVQCEQAHQMDLEIPDKISHVEIRDT